MLMKKLKLFLKDRGTGKTNTCINVAGLTDDTIIICHDALTAKRINDEIKIKKMKCKALSVWEYINNSEKYRGYNIIDYRNEVE